MADLTEVSNPYLSQIERGLHEPSVRVLKSIARALNVSAETLLAGLGDAAADHVVDPFGIDARAVEERLQGESEEVGGVPPAQSTFALAERRSNDVDDDGFSRVDGCHSLTR